MITKAKIETILEYRPEKGDFLWKITVGCVKSGRIAGGISANAYRHIKINKKYYKVHKLVWLMEHGVWPATIDHIDGDGLNNHISNLRVCTMSQNKANSRSYKNNKSGFKGVHYHKKLNRWRASIQCGGKRHFLGLFKTAEEAAAQYAASAALLFGEFARVA